MPSAVLCYAADDAAFADELIGYLRANCVALTFDRDQDDDLIDAAERALSADYVLLLLSKHSASGKWARNRWEPILVTEAQQLGTDVVYVNITDCEFPRVFRLHNFFDLLTDLVAGRRALRRWLVQKTRTWEGSVELPVHLGSDCRAPEDIHELECALVDQPGVITDVDRAPALALANGHREDFDAVFWLNCAHRSRAGILGDTAHALGLKLRGTLDQNAQAVRDFCEKRRILFVYENLAAPDRDLVTFGGHVSTMFIAETAYPAPASLAHTAQLFSRWNSNIDACLRALSDVQIHLRDAPESLGSCAFALLKHAGRVAEAAEIADLIISMLRSRGDVLAVSRWEWEKSWILEEWGLPVETRTPRATQAAQLELDFGGSSEFAPR